MAMAANLGRPIGSDPQLLVNRMKQTTLTLEPEVPPRGVAPLGADRLSDKQVDPWEINAKNLRKYVNRWMRNNPGKHKPDAVAFALFGQAVFRSKTIVGRVESALRYGYASESDIEALDDGTYRYREREVEKVKRSKWERVSEEDDRAYKVASLLRRLGYSVGSNWDKIEMTPDTLKLLLLDDELQKNLQNLI